MKTAYRKVRISLLAIILALGAAQAAQAAEVIITVKGTLEGQDYLGIFGKDKALPKGTPFTLVYTFDDANGEATKMRCPNAGSGISGAGEHSPGIAVITIGNASYVFGRKADARSNTWRAVPSDCTKSTIAMDVSEGRPPSTSAVNVMVRPSPNGKPLTTDADWRSPVSLTKFSALHDENGFTITRGGTYGLMTRAFLTLESVTVSSPEGDGR